MWVLFLWLSLSFSAAETRAEVLADAAAVDATIATEWAAYREEAIADGWQQQVRDRVVIVNDETMRYSLVQQIDNAERGANGFAVFISLHGGGQAAPEVNDQQWDNQQRRYQVPGLYVCPRAPRDTWDQFHNEYFHRFLERLIEHLILFEDVDPNRVYLMGYSSGGYGTIQLGPVLADRFAAFATAAAATEGAAFENLRNLPWDYQVGERDTAYGRIDRARETFALMTDLQAADPNGYVTNLVIHEGRGHGIDDRPSVTWMAQHVRNPLPSRVVWVQNHAARESSNPAHRHRYWLGLDPEYVRDESGRHEVTAEIEGQTIALTASGYTHLRIRLNDTMLDLDQPVIVMVNGAEVFRGSVEREAETVARTLREYGDPNYAFPVEIRIDLVAAEAVPVTADSDFGVSALPVVLPTMEDVTRSFDAALRDGVDAALLAAGENRSNITAALQRAPAAQRQAMGFLVAHMPVSDLETLSSDFLVENVALAFAASAAPWAEQVDSAHFLQYVLPYACVNERREDWRPVLFEQLREEAWKHDSPLAAARWINDNFETLFGVTFHATLRPKPDQSPFESIEAGYASCTGLSILMIDACRAVGIPARFVGVAQWTEVPGNHNWVEVFDGTWENIGSSGTDPRDDDWVNERCRNQTDPDQWQHSVFATTWRQTNTWFPLVWDLKNRSVPAVNVTRFYSHRSAVNIEVGAEVATVRVYWAGELVAVKQGAGTVTIPLATGCTFEVTIQREAGEVETRLIRT